MNSSPGKLSDASRIEAFVEEWLLLMPRMIREMMREERNMLSSGTISLPQFWLLQIVRERGSCCMHELADELQATPSGITAMTDRLEALDLVRRVPDTGDRRVIRVELTGAGEEMLSDIFDQRRTLMRKFYAGIPPKDCDADLRVLRRVLENLERARGGTPT